MGSQVAKIVGGVGMLIAIFLFVSNGTQTVNIINSLASNSIRGIKTLQGR